MNHFLLLHCIALQFIRELIATSTTTVQLLQYWYDPLSQRQSKWSFMLGTKLTKLFQWNIVNQMIWLVNIKLGVALRHCIWKLNIEHWTLCMLHAACTALNMSVSKNFVTFNTQFHNEHWWKWSFDCQKNEFKWREAQWNISLTWKRKMMIRWWEENGIRIRVIGDDP